MVFQVLSRERGMREAVPGTPIPPHGDWIMDKILEEGVSVQEEMIKALVENGEYVLESRRYVGGANQDFHDEKRVENRNKIIQAISTEVNTLLRCFAFVKERFHISYGPKFVRMSDGNNMYEIFRTKISR